MCLTIARLIAQQLSARTSWASPLMSSPPQISTPVFNTPTRWMLRVLSWLAFFVAAYLAWFSVNQDSVAGCGVGSHNGCDIVLNSAFAWWLGIPVAVLGLACYASLAGLSVLLGIQSSVSRWINTAFVMLAILAAGASLWFIGVQVFAIGAYCKFCLVTDVCGIAIGAIAVVAAAMRWRSAPRAKSVGHSSANLSSLRSAIPTGAKLAPVVGARTTTAATATAAPAAAVAKPQPAKTAATPSGASRAVPLVGSTSTTVRALRPTPPPSFPIAIGGALAMLLVLVGGQLVFPAKSFSVGQVSLNQPVDMSGNNSESADASSDAEPRTAMRISPDGEGGDAEQITDSKEASEDEKLTTDETSSTKDGSTESSTVNQTTNSDSPSAKRSRKIEFLKGGLKLDTYEQAIIGSPEAKHVVLELVSYDCPHCRKTNSLIKKALTRYGHQVAVIVLPLPLEQGCNRLVTNPAASHKGACTTARMALSVAELRPSSFARFHDFLMSGSDEKPPALDSIVDKAYGMVDPAKLRQLRDSESIKKRIAANVDLYANLQKQNTSKKEFGLPIQILGDTVVSGSIDKQTDLYDAWEKNLGVKPQ